MAKEMTAIEIILRHRTCTSKRVFLSKREAQKTADMMANRFGQRRPYRCRFCNAWHLTSKCDPDKNQNVDWEVEEK